jgi:hypothetical protein
MLLIRDYGVEKLRMNMEVNGYLPIDRVIVRKFKDGKFAVLEGNRRICAGKIITTINQWSAYNKANCAMEQERLNLTEAGKRFGLSAFGAGQRVRGNYAFKQAREKSDYVREVDERSYPYFQELFSRGSAPVRE